MVASPYVATGCKPRPAATAISKTSSQPTPSPAIEAGSPASVGRSSSPPGLMGCTHPRRCGVAAASVLRLRVPPASLRTLTACGVGGWRTARPYRPSPAPSRSTRPRTDDLCNTDKRLSGLESEPPLRQDMRGWGRDLTVLGRSSACDGPGAGPTGPLPAGQGPCMGGMLQARASGSTRQKDGVSTAACEVILQICRGVAN